MIAKANNIEQVLVFIYEDDKQASHAVAKRIAELIRTQAAKGESVVLGLATGHTPVNVYQELIRMHKEEGLDFTHVITFNLDEYWPIDPAKLQSYHHWMHENLFDHLNIKPENIHLPSGTVAEQDIEKHCQDYETAIQDSGGIDLQILGIGRSGHVGFNEPGSGRNSITRRIELDTITRKDAASDFFGEENVPQMALTMGVKSILSAREICLLAFGEHKAPIVKRAVEGEVSADVASTFLQEHPQATFFLDSAAAADLTRISTPWLVGPCQWDDYLKRHAVLWLAQKVDKPILKLTDEDYAENGLAELLRITGGSYRLNIEIFRQQMDTITGWPGGKGKTRKVIIFSPHPDDDVICMGGTMARFVEQGHELHVAYMVSGCLSVFDLDVSRYADFVRDFNHIFGLTPEQTEAIEEHIDHFLRQKKPGDIDSLEVQAIKGLIRRTEAIDAAKYCGLGEDHTHFLEMPFYNTGKVQKLSIAPEDIAAVRKILDETQPDIIFAAGDLSDPHGTHRLCLEALQIAICDFTKQSQLEPELWFYRGAWQEWSPEQIDMAVPLAPDEMKEKRYAIFRHQSQKDRAMFPGPFDSREFWQRAEERNMITAQIYDNLGLPEYHALEAFVRYPLEYPTHLKAQLTKEGLPSSIK
jgi:glucosamine-6-phosphate deaminase